MEGGLTTDTELGLGPSSAGDESVPHSAQLRSPLSVIHHSHRAAESFIKAPFVLPGHTWAVAGLPTGPSPRTPLQRADGFPASPQGRHHECQASPLPCCSSVPAAEHPSGSQVPDPWGCTQTFIRTLFGAPGQWRMSPEHCREDPVAQRAPQSRRERGGRWGCWGHLCAGACRS